MLISLLTHKMPQSTWDVLLKHTPTGPEEWMGEWATAASDPDGLIRADGKQLNSEIGLTLVNCDTSLNDHDKLTLTQMKDVIDAQIDQNIDYGPPCDPLCEPGPPIS